MTHFYRTLTDDQKSELRRQRVNLLEIDLYRAELQLEEVQSTGERAAVLNDIAAFQGRLTVHYQALGLDDLPPIEASWAEPATDTPGVGDG